MQPANIAIALRRRTPWEAIDLGLSMLQQWRRAVYAPHLVVAGVVTAVALLAGWLLERPWVAIMLIWWLKPVYDRVVLHVLSRAVFGERQATRAVLANWREWLGTGLFMALTFGRVDLATEALKALDRKRFFHGHAARPWVRAAIHKGEVFEKQRKRVCLEPASRLQQRPHPERRLEARHQPLDPPSRRYRIDLLHCFDQDYSGEAARQPRSHAFPGGRRAYQEAMRQGRHEQRLRPAER